MAKILGRGIPTAATYAILGQEYIDQLTGKRYICVKSRTITSDKVGEADHYCEWAEESAGGSGGGIIDVTELPTGGIDESALYRVTEGLFYNRYKQGVTYVVKSLPETGEPCTTDGTSIGTVYYNATDGVLYGYVPAAVGSVLGVSAGWYPAATLIGALGYVYVGVVNSFAEMTESDAFYLLVKHSYNACKDGVWTELSNSVSGARGGVIYIQLEATDGCLSPASGTLTDEQYTTITADPKNTSIDLYSESSHFIIPCAAWVTGNQYLYKSFEANEKYLFTYLLTVNSDKTWSYSVVANEV